MNLKGVEITLLDAEFTVIEVASFMVDRFSSADVDFMYVLGAMYLVIRMAVYVTSNYYKFKKDRLESIQADEDREHILIMREKELRKWSELFEKNMTNEEITEALKDPEKIKEMTRRLINGENPKRKDDV